MSGVVMVVVVGGEARLKILATCRYLTVKSC